MNSMTKERPQSGLDTHDAARKRLFAFLARPDGTVAEILDVALLQSWELADWMVGLYDTDDALCASITAALDQIDQADKAGAGRI